MEGEWRESGERGSGGERWRERRSITERKEERERKGRGWRRQEETGTWLTNQVVHIYLELLCVAVVRVDAILVKDNLGHTGINQLEELRSGEEEWSVLNRM